VFEKIIEKIGKILASHKIPYMIIGGQAVLLYGEPRLTKDIDITLGVGADALPGILKLVRALKFKVLVENPEEFVSKTMVLPVLDKPTGIRVDLIFSYSTYESGAIKRARKIKFGSHMVKYASLEDVIIHKLVAGRPRDIEDVKSILIKNPDYDRKYISKWLKKFDSSLGTTIQKNFRSIVKELK